MKRLLFGIVFGFVVSMIACADNFKAPTRSSGSVEYTDTTTTHTYEIKETKFPVFKSKNGAFYIWKTSSKTGKQYKYYLPKEIQIAMGREYPENK